MRPFSLVLPALFLTLPALAAPRPAPTAKSDTAEIHKQFAAKDAIIADLRRQLAQAQAEIAKLQNAAVPPGQVAVTGPAAAVDVVPRRYVFTPLNTLIPAKDVPPGVALNALGVNKKGRIVGTLQTGMNTGRAFVWDPVTGMHDLGLPPGFQNSRGDDINEAGEAVCDFEWQPARPFLWHDGQMVDLGSLGGVHTHGYRIGPGGLVTGYSELNADIYHAFVWRQGRMEDLGTLPNYPTSRAFGSNTAGDIVGDAYTSLNGKATNDTPSRAVLWRDGHPTDLGVLGGIQSLAKDINAKGQIAGSSTTGGRTKEGYWIRHAVLWDHGKIVDLGIPHPDLYPDSNSDADALNAAGQVVGTGTGKEGSVACLWEHGKCIDLNSLLPPDSGWVLMYADRIDDSGRILGVGIDTRTPDLDVRSFMLTPVKPHGPSVP